MSVERPPAQRPYETALKIAFDRLAARDLTRETLNALGVELVDGSFRVQALNSHLLVDPQARQVTVEGAGRARTSWALLVVHYLCAEDVTQDSREVSLAHFPSCRGYLAVFQKRIVGRFLATTGRSGEVFSNTSKAIGGEVVNALSMSSISQGFSFSVLPRITITIVRHEGDDEFGAGATVVYRADAERLLPAEDCIVAAELLLDTLAGKPMTEN